MKSLLEMLEEDSHLTPAELAVMYEKDEGDIRRMIDEYETAGCDFGIQDRDQLGTHVT